MEARRITEEILGEWYSRGDLPAALSAHLPPHEAAAIPERWRATGKGHSALADLIESSLRSYFQAPRDAPSRR